MTINKWHHPLWDMPDFVRIGTGSPPAWKGGNAARPSPDTIARPSTSPLTPQDTPTAIPRNKWPKEAIAAAALAIEGENGLGTVLVRLLSRGDDNDSRWLEVMRALRTGCGCVGNGQAWVDSKYPLTV